MTEAVVPAKTEDKGATDRRLVVAGAVIVVLGGIIVGLVQLIRHSPCFGHADGPEPLVKVAQESARMAPPRVSLVEPPGSDEADQAPDNGHVDTLPRVVPPTRTKRGPTPA